MKTILIIGKTWPESKSTGAGVRLRNLILVLLKNNFDVVFCSASKKSQHTDELSELNIKSYEILINDYSFNDFISKLKPDIVLFDRFTTEEQFGWRVRESLPDALTILDTEDLHSLRDARKVLVERNEFPYSQKQELDVFRSSVLAHRELASIYRCDFNLIISDYEYKLLVELGIPKSILFYLPMYSFQPNDSKEVVPFEDRKNFIFFGNFNHAPNLDCLKQIHVLFPRIRKVNPSLEIHVYGEYLKEQQYAKNKNGIFFHGWTPNLIEKINQSRLLFAPLRFGAGLKSKIIEAMNLGTPIASTHIGFEGLCANENTPGVSGDLDESWLNRCIDLYNNEEVWKNASKLAIENSKKLSVSYNRQNLELIEVLKNIEDNLNEYRSKNLVGKILSLEQNRSHKFMSKYIEEKNKRRPTN